MLLYLQGVFMKILLMIILAFTISIMPLYSSENTDRNTEAFSQYKDKVTVILKSLKTELKKVYSIFLNVQSKNDLLKQKNNLKQMIKLTLNAANRIVKIKNIIKEGIRSSFQNWVQNLDSELNHLIIKTFSEKTRVISLPGCRVIIAEIDNEMQLYGRSLNNR